MTDDLVARLRKVGQDYDFHGNALVYEAADEIERLRAALREIIDEDNGPFAAIARAALAGEKTNDAAP